MEYREFQELYKDAFDKNNIARPLSMLCLVEYLKENGKISKLKYNNFIEQFSLIDFEKDEHAMFELDEISKTISNTCFIIMVKMIGEVLIKNNHGSNKNIS